MCRGTISGIIPKDCKITAFSPTDKIFSPFLPLLALIFTPNRPKRTPTATSQEHFPQPAPPHFRAPFGTKNARGRKSLSRALYI